MELMKSEKTEVVVFGKGFVPVLGFFFTGTESEFTRLRELEKSGEKIHIIIDENRCAIIAQKEV